MEAAADPDDPFGDEDDCRDEVAALAKKFEEKYVSNISTSTSTVRQ